MQFKKIDITIFCICQKKTRIKCVWKFLKLCKKPYYIIEDKKLLLITPEQSIKNKLPKQLDVIVYRIEFRKLVKNSNNLKNLLLKYIYKSKTHPVQRMHKNIHHHSEDQIHTKKFSMHFHHI